MSRTPIPSIGARPQSEERSCDRCGAKYDMDAYLTDEEWRAISGHDDGSGYLCVWCIDDLAVEKGVRYRALLYFTGYAGDAISGFEAIEDGRRVNWNKRA